MSLQRGHAYERIPGPAPTEGEEVVAEELRDLDPEERGKKRKHNGSGDEDEPAAKKDKVVAAVRQDLADLGSPIYMHFPANLALFGATQSGKTSLLRTLMKQHNYDKTWQVRIVFTATKETGNINEFASNPKLVLTKCNDATLLTLRKMMKEKVNRGKQMLLLFDDFYACDGWDSRYSKVFESLAQSGRNDNMSIVMTAQSYVSIPTALRRNLLYILIGRVFDKDILALSKEFAVANMPCRAMTNTVRDIATRCEHEFLMIPVREGKGPFLIKARPEDVTAAPGSDLGKKKEAGDNDNEEREGGGASEAVARAAAAEANEHM
jgi:hypothetical protein